MTEPHIQFDTLNEQNLLVMQAYDLRATAAKAAGEEGFDGWLERLSSVPDLTADELVSIHGQLIALGFLKFEISGRHVGLRYQISPRGRQALQRAIAQADTAEQNAQNAAA